MVILFSKSALFHRKYNEASRIFSLLKNERDTFPITYALYARTKEK